MTSVLSKNMAIFSAEQFLESVSESSSSNLYLTFGRVSPWPNDAAPIQANSSVSSHYEVWSNMVGGKKVSGNDVRHVIPRHDWTSNTVYDAYDQCTCSLPLFDANTKFVVVTDDWNVYKCIANNYGDVSTEKPSSIQTNKTFQTTDGYIWKYMYTINNAERLRFTTDEYIPVKTLTLNDNSLQWSVQENAIDGGIESIKLTNFGTKYSNANNIVVTITGDGTGATAYATINTTTNTISSILIDEPGRNYTTANVRITAANGSGAVARAIISPPGGHGSDPLHELGGSNLLINMRIRGSEGGMLSTENDFRQIALIQNPIYKDGTTQASNVVFSQLTTFIVNGSSVDYTPDEVVYQGTTLASAYFKGVVESWDSANLVLRLTNTTGSPRADLVIGTESRATWYVNTINTPDFLTNSGKLLYIDNIKPVTRSIDQTEDFKLVLRF